MKVGDRVSTKNSGKITIIEMINRDRVLIEFEDGNRKEIPRKSLYDGKVKNGYQPSVCGVGIVGEGIAASTKESKSWRSMLNRCYGIKNRQASYLGCTTAEEWHLLPNYADWCQTVVGFKNQGWELDKDLLIPSNKVYSSETCIFLPKRINTSITGYASGEGIKGVHYSPQTKHYSVAYFNQEEARETGRSFKDEEAAWDFYRVNRFNRLKFELIIHAKDLDPRALSRLLEIVKF